MKKIISVLFVVAFSLTSFTYVKGTELNYTDVEKFVYAQVITAKGPLNVRTKESTKAKRVTSIPNKSYVLVNGVDDDGEWVNVTFEGKTGFVQSKFLSIIEELPFETIENGKNDRDLEKLKERLQDLGYFNRHVDELSYYYTETFQTRLNIFYKTNNIQPTQDISPKMQAYIYWGSPQKNVSKLPPATYYVRNDESNNGGNNTDPSTPVTDPSSGLTASATIQRLGYNYNTSIWSEVNTHFAISLSISGGTAPYSHTVSVSGGNMDRYKIDGNKLSITATNQEVWGDLNGKHYDTASVIVIITDANNNQITLNKSAQYLISAPSSIDAEGEGEVEKTQINANISLQHTGTSYSDNYSKITNSFKYSHSISGGTPPYQTDITARYWIGFGAEPERKVSSSSTSFSYTMENEEGSGFDGSVYLILTVTDNTGESAMFYSNTVKFPKSSYD